MAKGKAKTEKGDVQPIIIIKRVKKVAGGHHGGAWKVAYADFVTAMMAFFLLLWLLNVTTAQVENDRLKAAQDLVNHFHCTVVLKGSGTVIAAPGQTPRINTSGNGRLATGGTGDVLAGLIGARMAQGLSAFDAACSAVAQHGQVANDWPEDQALTASELARHLN